MKLSYEQQWELVLEYLRKYAENSLSYLSVEPDKQWFFSEGFEGFASYAVSGRTMVVCGDPICADENFSAFLQQLKDFASEHRYNIIFLMTRQKHLDEYRAEGFGCHKGGEEAVFDVQSWSMAGGKCAKVRSSWHTAVHKGLVVREYRPWQKREKDIEDQFIEITDRWLEAKYTSRLQFAVGSMMLDRPCDKRYFYAVDGSGTIQGFNVLNPYMSGRAWIVDIMRRREGCPHGVMELLFHDIMEKLKEEGAVQASLGAAPFYNTNDSEHPDLPEKAEHYIYEHMNRIYGFEALQEAKKKFNPEWENIYLVCHPRHISLRMAENAFAVLDSHGFSDFVRTFAENLGKKKKASPAGKNH